MSGYFSNRVHIYSGVKQRWSFSILSRWFSLRSFNSSFCSGVRLFFSWKDPGFPPALPIYQTGNGQYRIPGRYHICVCRNAINPLAAAYIGFIFYDLKKSVQFIVNYPILLNLIIFLAFKQHIFCICNNIRYMFLYRERKRISRHL